jgi:ketosteroid isomerase-like protein
MVQKSRNKQRSDDRAYQQRDHRPFAGSRRLLQQILHGGGAWDPTEPATFVSAGRPTTDKFHQEGGVLRRKCRHWPSNPGITVGGNEKASASEIKQFSRKRKSWPHATRHKCVSKINPWVRKMKTFISLVAFAVLFTTANAEEFKMPERKKQPNAAAVVAEHVDALNNCDLNRIMAQYPDDGEFILPNGIWMKGRNEIVNLFLGFCKDRADGGLKGAKFIAEETNVVGDVINVSWRMEAPYLKEPYKGADAYETKDGLMQTQVTTFELSDMKFK